MDDNRSASFVMIAGAAGLAYWWFHLTRGELSSTVTAGGPAAGNSGLPQTKVDIPLPHNLESLKRFAAEWRLPQISGYRPGANSLHGEGLALDVGVPPDYLKKQVQQAADMLGIHVYPEATGQVGANGSVSTRPHWHLSWPQMRNGRMVF
jgi:hypothetical protein